jgi:hypothetical protein
MRKLWHFFFGRARLRRLRLERIARHLERLIRKDPEIDVIEKANILSGIYLARRMAKR